MKKFLVMMLFASLMIFLVGCGSRHRERKSEGLVAFKPIELVYKA